MTHPTSVPDLIENKDGLYEGDLKHYFKHIFYASNVRNPYHNFRHMMHVAFGVYDAMKYYNYFETYGPKKARCFLIAAMFHDFGHLGKKGNDHDNIIVAKKGLSDVLLPEDADFLGFMENIIDATEYPHVDVVEETLEVQIIRDADMAQTFANAWLQQVIFGLSQEMGITPFECLDNEEEFIQGIHFYTEWAKSRYTDDKELRVSDSKRLLNILK